MSRPAVHGHIHSSKRTVDEVHASAEGKVAWHTTHGRERQHGASELPVMGPENGMSDGQAPDRGQRQWSFGLLRGYQAAKEVDKLSSRRGDADGRAQSAFNLEQV